MATAAATLPGDLRAVASALTRALDAADVGVMITELQSGEAKITFVSDGLAAQLGSSPEALMGRDATEFLVVSERGPARALTRDLENGRHGPLEWVVRLQHPGGRDVELSSYTSMLESEGR